MVKKAFFCFGFIKSVKKAYLLLLCFQKIMMHTLQFPEQSLPDEFEQASSTEREVEESDLPDKGEL